MTRPAILKSVPMLDLEISSLVNDLHSDAFGSLTGPISAEIDPRIYFQRMALNLTLMICYSTRIKSTDDPMLHELLYLANSIST
jgi:phenylacetate 2-hydroxylase